jgi:hypothetical protein
MIESIADIEVGKSYACKFKVKTLLDVLGTPAPNLSDQPLGGEGWYEGFGVIMQRDNEQKLVLIKDEASKKEFPVEWENCFEIDDVEWVDPLVKE